MLISIIVAASDNDVIGRGGSLPWRQAADLRHFRDTTRGHVVIMGRRTFESIGRALPDRVNIVVSRQDGYKAAGCLTAPSLDAALDLARAHEKSEEGEAFVIGGADLYRTALEKADRLYLTRVHASILGDVFFPPLNQNLFKVSKLKELPADEHNDYPTSFYLYERI